MIARKGGGFRSIEDAERYIHAYAQDDPELAYTEHAKRRCRERGITTSDVMYILSHGRIHAKPEGSTRPGYWKYRICSRAPNSGSRRICLVVIPDAGRPAIKVVTVMWEDRR